MSILRRPYVLPGILSGLLFVGHAYIPYSHAWPYLWPLFGGAITLWRMRRRGDSISIPRTIGLGAQIGAIAAVVGMLGLAVTLPFILRELSVPMKVYPLTALGVIPAMLLAIPVAIIGAVLGRVLGHRRRHRAVSS